jgi:cyclic dehypoxanthinyl futalosine synthase
MQCKEIVERFEAGERISQADALVLYQSADLLTLGQLARTARERTNPGKIVTYLVDRNINYTNVCNTDCSFCAFYRPHSTHPESYVLTKEVLGRKIEEALQFGATRILLQGGHNDSLPYEFYLDMIAWIHERYPIELNAFSPSEIHQMHLVSGKSYREILSELQAAGLRGLPGGGAEILHDEIRKRVSPKKIPAQLWIDIMEVAQELNLTTTASMVIGFGETPAHRLSHLALVRDLNDRSAEKGVKGFNAFISWTLKLNENTSMGRSRRREDFGVELHEYLRNIAMARIFLDNVPHHQSSWPTDGPEVAQLGIIFGCDDIGSTMMEENVVSQAGAPTKERWSMSPEELRDFIRGVGFIPAQRNSSFELLQVFSEATV